MRGWESRSREVHRPAGAGARPPGTGVGRAPPGRSDRRLGPRAGRDAAGDSTQPRQGRRPRDPAHGRAARQGAHARTRGCAEAGAQRDREPEAPAPGAGPPRPLALRRRGQGRQGDQRAQQLHHALADGAGARTAAVAAAAAGRDADHRAGDAGHPDADSEPHPSANPRSHADRRRRPGHANADRDRGTGRRGPAGGPAAADPVVRGQASALYAAQDVAAGAIAADARRHPPRPHAPAQRPAARGRDASRVHDHPELGSTTTAADGTFELAVNGGAQLTLEYTRAGYLEVQRDIDPTQLDWTNPPDVVMLDAEPRRRRPEPARGRGVDRAARALRRPTATARARARCCSRPARRRRCASPTARRRRCPARGRCARRSTRRSARPRCPPTCPPPPATRTPPSSRSTRREAAGAGLGRAHRGEPTRPRRRGQLRRELHRRAGRHRRPDRRLRPHRRGVGAVTGRPRREGDLRDRRHGEPRHRRRRRQRRRRLPREAQAHGCRAHRARAALRARRRAVPRPDPAPVAVGPQLAVRATRRARGGRGWARTDGRSRTCASRAAARRSAARTRSSARPSTSPARRTGSRTRRTGSRARPRSARSTSPSPSRRCRAGLLAVELEVEIAGQTISATLRRSGRATRLRPAADHAERRRRTSSGTASTARGPAGHRVRAGPPHAELLLPAASTRPGRLRRARSRQVARRRDRHRSRAACAARLGRSSPGLATCARSSSRRGDPRCSVGIDRSSTGLGGWDLDAHHVYDALTREVRLGDGTIRRGGDVELGRLRTVAGPGPPAPTACR